MNLVRWLITGKSLVHARALNRRYRFEALPGWGSAHVLQGGVSDRAVAARVAGSLSTDASGSARNGWGVVPDESRETLLGKLERLRRRRYLLASVLKK